MVDRVIPEEIKLFEGEEISLSYKRKYLSFLIPLLVGGVIVMGILITIYFSYMITSSEFVNFLGQLLIIIFALIFILAATLGLGYTRSHRFYVSNERIIIYKKFVSIAIRDVWFEYITDLIVDQGPIGRIFNYGNINPITAGIEAIGMVKSYLSFTGVENPNNVRKQILEIKQKIFRGND